MWDFILGTFDFAGCVLPLGAALTWPLEETRAMERRAEDEKADEPKPDWTRMERRGT